MLTKNVKPRVHFLDNLRALAILMVVVIHVVGYSSSLTPEFTSVILKATVMVAVPIFFLVDGYLLCESTIYKKNDSYKNVVVKSAYRLLLPWVLFSIGYLIIRYVFELLGYLDDYLVVGKSKSDVVLFLYGSVYAGQMYFLLSLFFIRLCTPLLVKLFVDLSVYSSSVVFLLLLYFYKNNSSFIYSHFYIAGGQEPLTHAIWGLQFYILGMLVFRLRFLFQLKMVCLFAILFGIGIALNISSIFQYAYLLLIFFIFFHFVNAQWKPVNFVGKNTMGIYLLHSPLVIKFTAIATNMLVAAPVMVFALNVCIVFLMSIAIVQCMRWVGIGKFMFGEWRPLVK